MGSARPYLLDAGIKGATTPDQSFSLGSLCGQDGLELKTILVSQMLGLQVCATIFDNNYFLNKERTIKCTTNKQAKTNNS